MRIERTSDNTFIVHPDYGKHSGTIIFCHGLGDSSDGFSSVAESLNELMPHIKFILPTAHSIPVTLNNGMKMPAWYDIVGLDITSESCDGIESSAQRIIQLIEKEVDSGIPYNRIILGGFSQGYQLPSDKKLGGLIVLSGYLPGASKFKLTSGLESIPVLHCHGTSDPVVKFDWAKKSEQFIKSKGASNYELKSYNGVVHTVTPDIITDVTTFLSTYLPSIAVKSKSPNEMSIKELKESIKNAGLSRQALGFSEKTEFIDLLIDYYKKHNIVIE